MFCSGLHKPDFNLRSSIEVVHRDITRNGYISEFEKGPTLILLYMDCCVSAPHCYYSSNISKWLMWRGHGSMAAPAAWMQVNPPLTLQLSRSRVHEHDECTKPVQLRRGVFPGTRHQRSFFHSPSLRMIMLALRLMFMSLSAFRAPTGSN